MISLMRRNEREAHKNLMFYASMNEALVFTLVSSLLINEYNCILESVRESLL